MKKTNIKVGMLIIVLMFVLGTLFAATTGNYQIKVKVVEESVGITITAGSLDLGYIVQGTSVTTKNLGSTAVKNTGAVNINLQARISDNTFGWSTGTVLSDSGADKYVLAMIFHEWNGLEVSTNAYACFGNDDVLTATNKTATVSSGGSDGIFAARFIDNQSVATPEGFDGVGLKPDDTVNSHFFFNAPTSLSNSSQYGQEQTITVTITAVQQ